MQENKVSLALFDIRAGEPRELQRVVNLRKSVSVSVPVPEPIPAPALPVSPPVFENLPYATDKDIIAHEVEYALSQLSVSPQPITQQAEIIVQPEPVAPVVSLELPTQASQDFEQFWIQSVKPVRAMPVQIIPKLPKRRLTMPRLPTFHIPWRAISLVVLIVIGIGGTVLAVTNSGVFNAREQVVQNGTQALGNLEDAKNHLVAMDFAAAADSFALAHDDFGSASQTMSRFGASILGLFGNIPGLRNVHSAQNLVQAGKLFAESGEALSRSLDRLSSTNFFALVHPGPGTDQASLAAPLEDMHEALKVTEKRIAKASTLMGSVSLTLIPEDSQATFTSFQEKLPLFQEYLSQAITYSDFLLRMIGQRVSQTYLVLLQNTTERRPSGGFPGTYAIVTFDKGKMTKLFLDDIYNPDGQIRANIVPPAPLQHITPNWGMRDVNWFADFPTTARKVQEYYALDGGGELDGVFAVSPTIIARILEIIGPIPMPEYEVILDAGNFLTEIQDEVEYGENRTQPKKIVADFQPIFFEKLAQQDQAQWMKIAQVLLGSFQEKHLLAYFDDEQVQEEAVKRGFAGELKSGMEDYLQVAFANIKGSKSDGVTDNAFNLSVKVSDDQIKHDLKITRAHNGGDSPYLFYNRDNPAYVKVYVPKGAVLEGVEGIALPDYKPLVDYVALGFKKDADLETIENTMTHPFPGVDVFEESGKTVFGFWMVVKPKKVTSAQIIYSTPRTSNALRTEPYVLYLQKQSGSDGDQIHASIQLPEGSSILNHSLETQLLGSTVTLDGELSVDREVRVVYD